METRRLDQQRLADLPDDLAGVALRDDAQLRGLRRRGRQAAGGLDGVEPAAGVAAPVAHQAGLGVPVVQELTVAPDEGSGGRVCDAGRGRERDAVEDDGVARCAVHDPEQLVDVAQPGQGEADGLLAAVQDSLPRPTPLAAVLQFQAQGIAGFAAHNLRGDARDLALVGAQDLPGQDARRRP